MSLIDMGRINEMSMIGGGQRMPYTGKRGSIGRIHGDFMVTEECSVGFVPDGMSVSHHSSKS